MKFSVEEFSEKNADNYFAVAYAVTKTGSEWDDVKTDRVQPVFVYPDPENGKGRCTSTRPYENHVCAQLKATTTRHYVTNIPFCLLSHCEVLLM